MTTPKGKSVRGINADLVNLADDLGLNNEDAEYLLKEARRIFSTALLAAKPEKKIPYKPIEQRGCCYSKCDDDLMIDGYNEALDEYSKRIEGLLK